MHHAAGWRAQMKPGPYITGVIVAALALFAAGSGCDDEGNFTEGADYSQCEGEIINNQEVVCNSLKTGVEDLCGFSLTIDPCVCAGEVQPCTTDTAWLEQIMDCSGAASDCGSYTICLEGVGESPSGCSNPTEWECIVTASQ